MKSKIQKFYIILLVTGLWLLATASVQAAYFKISPSSGNYYKGENFEVRILVNSDVAINAVSGVLTFPTKNLGVIEVNKKNSLINLWIREPSFSNAGEFGNVRFEGVILNPGFIGSDGRVLNILFRVKDKGVANVEFVQSMILANDGQGTNVIAPSGAASFILLPERSLPAGEKKQAKELVQPIIIKELQAESPSDILSFWKDFPEWVKISVSISIGLTTIVFSFIILSFGIIFLIWLWSSIWHRRDQFFALLRLAAQILKNLAVKTLNFVGVTEREIKSDIRYSLYQLASEFKKAPHVPSFKGLIKDYFFLIGNIVKRFFTKNTTENLDEKNKEVK